jgi:hypothetical protein
MSTILVDVNSHGVAVLWQMRAPEYRWITPAIVRSAYSKQTVT